MNLRSLVAAAVVSLALVVPAAARVDEEIARLTAALAEIYDAQTYDGDGASVAGGVRRLGESIAGLGAYRPAQIRKILQSDRVVGAVAPDPGGLVDRLSGTGTADERDAAVMGFVAVLMGTHRFFAGTREDNPGGRRLIRALFGTTEARRLMDLYKNAVSRTRA